MLNVIFELYLSLPQILKYHSVALPQTPNNERQTYLILTLTCVLWSQQKEMLEAI